MVKPARPVKASSVITSPYGMRTDPFTGEQKMHNGTDFDGVLNDPIYASMAGTVLFASFHVQLGNYIFIKHKDDKYFTGYAHTNQMLVKVGDNVTKGQQIARMGTTGSSTGVHLHFILSDGTQTPFGVYLNSTKYLEGSTSGGGNGTKEENMNAFVHANVSTDFGLSIDVVAEKCKSYGRFSAWLNSDINKIKEVLNKVKSNGVSPAFFASYEKTEGYNSSWGWLNHTKPNGNPLQDSDSVSKWIVSQSNNMTDVPAWIDYANYKDFVPNDVKVAGNADFASMTGGSIGRVVIAGTAAATWEVYYPNGLKKEYNGVQNYGAPINDMIETIIAWGGVMGVGGSNGGNGEDEAQRKKDDFYHLVVSKALWGVLNI